MKKAFTMIELVFVIIILGILASISLPKLVATKTDAEVTKMVVLMSNFITTVATLDAVGNKSIQDAVGERPNAIGISQKLLMAVASNGRTNEISEEFNSFYNQNEWLTCLVPSIDNDKKIQFTKLRANQVTPKPFCPTLLVHPTVKEWVTNGVALGGSSILNKITTKP
ncbi:hypothetical protein A9K75_05665 [Campylobacter fetus subsp. testudinum]|uniref:type II secretion system protein n=1 Tax=Campylobacter fetus TaxID=196 RepID=UPI00081884BC|nr:type II secretion system protein [Campylobacter fetus]OCR99796.1 hypothetical protein A9K75_05665 [Campylobacter fetus subsp. testudinum]